MKSPLFPWLNPGIRACLTAAVLLTACEPQNGTPANVPASPQPTGSITPSPVLRPQPTPIPSASLTPPTPSGSPTAPPAKPTAKPSASTMPTPLPTASPTASPTATGSPQPTPSPTGSGVVTQEDISLSASGFGPDSVTIKKGSTVTWINLSQTSKTLHSEQALFPDTTLPGRGSSFAYVFNTPGTYTFNNGTASYLCTVIVHL